MPYFPDGLPPEDQPPQQIPFTPDVLPQPAPMQWVMQRVDAGGRALIAITVYNVHGQFVMLLDPRDAKALAAQMDAEASLAVSGLWTP